MIARLIAHLRGWFREYLLAAIMAFPVIWLESADVRALLPPELVSKIAPWAAAILLIERVRARIAAARKP